MEGSPLVPINAAAAQLGVSVRTLRYYEEVGLLAEAERGPGGVRFYSEAALERVRRVIDLRQAAGLTLEEVREFLDAEARLDALKGPYHAGAAPEKLKLIDQAEEQMLRQLAVIDAKMAGLTRLRTQVADRLERVRGLRDTLL